MVASLLTSCKLILIWGPQAVLQSTEMWRVLNSSERLGRGSLDLVLAAKLIPPPGCVWPEALGLMLWPGSLISEAFAHPQGVFTIQLSFSPKQGWQKGKSHKNLKFTRATTTKLPYMEIISWWCCLGAASTEVAILWHTGSRVLKISSVLQRKLRNDIGQTATSKLMPRSLCGMCPLSSLISLELKSKHCLFF